MNRNHPFKLRQNKPYSISPIEDRSLSRLVASAPAIRVKLSEAKSRLVGISDFDILNFVLQANNYAKQTQFPKRQNHRILLCRKELRKCMPSRTVKKQTQFQHNHPQTTQPTIRMQNKPNFPSAKMNVTSYGHKEYEHKLSLRTLAKQTQSIPILNLHTNIRCILSRRATRIPVAIIAEIWYLTWHGWEILSGLGEKKHFYAE